MKDADDWSRIEKNRLAFAAVVASAALVVIVGALSLAGVVRPTAGSLVPDLTTLPLYAVGVVTVLGLVLWSWGRVASFFE